ncbi:hypothetical protein [Rhizobium sp. RU36D]|uniref:hypothetical protein n=1 Tax=Rhizobium sp. RU36D TaxID=1907415 RepID=UPI00117AF03E|nr:hypothetical protein [Rhizobium sp. RU36D]
MVSTLSDWHETTQENKVERTIRPTFSVATPKHGISPENKEFRRFYTKKAGEFASLFVTDVPIWQECGGQSPVEHDA